MPTQQRRRHSSVYLDKRSLELLQVAEEAGLDVNLSQIVRDALPGALEGLLGEVARGKGGANARRRLRARLGAPGGNGDGPD